MEMDAKKIRQLKVINKIRGITNIAAGAANDVILQYFGISEEDYIGYGQTWRELGSTGIVIYFIINTASMSHH